MPRQERPGKKDHDEHRHEHDPTPVSKEALTAAQGDREKVLRAEAEAWVRGEEQNVEGAKALSAAFAVQEPLLAAEAEAKLTAVSKRLFEATAE